MNFRTLTIAAILTIVPACAAFAGGPSANEVAAAKLVQDISHGQLHLSSTFPGPVPDIVGVIAQAKGGQKMLAWMVDGKFLATGQLVDASGSNLTDSAAQAQGLMPKPMAVGIFAQKTMRAASFTLGKSGPLVVAYEDPNCIYCHKLDVEAAPLIASGKLRLRVIPVAFLKPTSAGRATAILQAKSPVQAWNLDQSRFDVSAEEGGMPPATQYQGSAAYREIKANTSLLSASGQLATPTLLVCEKGKKTPQVLRGIGPGQISEIASSAVNITESGICAE